ncbi:hypothetical protein [Paraliomyxa miuraensis]|uniref:hypothetical protein n=1 Tax=Paraliomyxa miuraensis TaxID=376150 RepID=UPI00225361BB|nr:hypothetical protein [Paraliomyxa miuraensis]MCX4248059.1 hypothetical protein [Paraliomyxa miuraensis]
MTSASGEQRWVDPTPLVERTLEHLDALGCRRVVLHGYRGRSHTHHWVMWAIERAWIHILRDRPDVSLCWADNRNPLPFEALEQAVVWGNVNVDRVDYTLPIVPGACYVMHDHHPGRTSTADYAEHVASGRALFYEVFRGHDDPDARPVDGEVPVHTWSPARGVARITWGTDLLPDEIAHNRELVVAAGPRRPPGEVVFVGSAWRNNADDLAALAQAAVERGLRFVHHGRVMTDVRWPDHPMVVSTDGSVSHDDNVRLVREALVAPAFQGKAQLPNPDERGNYVPCRIYKNISYGAPPVTNNATVKTLLGEGVALGRTPGQMLDAALAVLEADPQQQALEELMAEVARRHTYLSRVEMLMRLMVEHREARARVPAPGARRAGAGLRLRKLAHRVVGRRWQ